jgi:hypothetical protein
MRIVESLRAPRPKSRWYNKALLGGATLVLVWFVATVAVAFLREAKALRRGREALQMGEAQQAYNWLDPFMKDHPENPEGLFLAGMAAVKLSLVEQTRSYYDGMRRLSPDPIPLERVGELEHFIRNEISAFAVAIGCNFQHYSQFYVNFQALGQEFSDTLRGSAAHVVRSCLAKGDDRSASSLAQWLIRETGDPALVTILYVEPMKVALHEGKYTEVAKLAQQASRLSSASGPTITEALSDVRRRAGETEEGLQRLCASLRSNPSHRVGRFWCFPQSPPEVVTSARDGWDRPLAYSALALDETIQCHQGFTLVSLGADGKETPDDHTSPAAEISCRFLNGKESWSRPDRFWLPTK